MNLLKHIENYRYFRSIISLNNNNFKKKNKFKKNQVLIEFNNFSAAHIGLSYSINILKDKYDAKTIAYPGHVLLSYPLRQTIMTKIKRFLLITFNMSFYGVYKSFGTNEFYYPKANKIIKKQSDKTYFRFKRDVKNLKSLENYKIKKIHIGDLLYDTYLKNQYSMIPTIDLQSTHFQKFAYDFILLFEIWFEYIKKNRVKAIIGSHSVYVMGMVLKIAQKRKIATYVLTHEELWKLNSSHPVQDYFTKHLRQKFRNLSKKKQLFIKNTAKKKIALRLKGSYSAEYAWITKSPFVGTGHKIPLKKNKRNIFVIATHDFVDAPHARGKSLFPDFYQWFTYLCELSTKTNDIWLIKNHPDFEDEYAKYMKYERDVTHNVCLKYKNITILNKKTSLIDLSKMNVDAVFSVNGTIGFDLPLLNIPVINASLNNPHINYKFNYHPKNIKELKNLVLNFDKYKKKIKINKDELHEFYGMKTLFFKKNWFYSDLNKITKEIGSYHNFSKPSFYDYWVKHYSKFDEAQTIKNLNEYFNSNNTHLLNNNLGKY